MVSTITYCKLVFYIILILCNINYDELMFVRNGCLKINLFWRVLFSYWTADKILVYLTAFSPDPAMFIILTTTVLHSGV